MDVECCLVDPQIGEKEMGDKLYFFYNAHFLSP